MIEGLRQIPWWRNILTQRVTQIEGCFRWSRPPHSEISASHFLDNLPTTSLTFNLLYISLQKKLVLCSHISFGQYVNIYKAIVFKKVPQGQDRRHVHIQNPQLDVLREGSRNDHFSFRAFPRDLFICGTLQLAKKWCILIFPVMWFSFSLGGTVVSRATPSLKRSLTK